MENENLTNDEYFELMNIISRLNGKIKQLQSVQEEWQEVNQRCDDLIPLTWDNYRGE